MNFEEFKAQYQKVPVEEYPNQAPDEPMVSVCVQTYQHAPYIRECLDGILMQETDFVYEILLGEDDSTDGTREICIEYAEKHPDKIRLFLHHRENNIQILGLPTGRFNSLTNLYSSNGKYIAFCEGDDYWIDPSKLQKQYNFMEANPDYSFCGHDAFILKGEEKISKSKLSNNYKRDFTSYEVKRGVFVLTLSAFIKNLRSYPDECLNIVNFDTFLFIYLGEYGHFKYLEDIQPACYRIHDGGMWSSISQNRREISELNTHFWLSKYFDRTNQKNLKDHFGLRVVLISLNYLVEPTWRNIAQILKYIFILKYPKITSRFLQMREFGKGKL